MQACSPQIPEQMGTGGNRLRVSINAEERPTESGGYLETCTTETPNRENR